MLSRSARRPAHAAWLIALAFFAACEGEAPPRDESLSVRQPAQEPLRARPEPPPRRRTGQHVTYTVARGGTLLNVANLYKLGHDEIIALNPEIDPDRELAPNAEVIVYAGGDDRSESVGLPHDGSILGAMPMLNGPGRRVTAERWKTWGTQSTIRQLDKVLSRWAREHPDWPEVLVGNISRRKGGPIEPHKTHQSGRDVDLGYVPKPDKALRGWQKMNATNLDAEKTWTLMQAFISETNVEVIYADRKLQQLLLRAARKRPRVRADQLRKWFEVAPGARRGETLIRHIPQHDDHFHIRFSCGDAERQCRS
jgi:murein endopeptidase